VIEQHFELLFQLAFELYRIELGHASPQSVFLLRAQMRAGQQAVARSLSFGIFADGLGTDPGFALELERGAEKIVQRSPRFIRLVHQLNSLRAFDALLAQELTHVGEVFLLDVRLVVLLVGPAAAQIHRRGPVQEIAP